MPKGEKAAVSAPPAPPPFPVPPDAAAVNEFIRDLGINRRERDRIQAAMNEELAKVRARYEEKARPFSEKADQLERGLRTWCEAHRAELTDQGKVKTHRFGAGEICWKNRPASVVIADAKAVLAHLIDRGMKKFIRVTRAIDKQAMLKDPDKAAKVPGVKIESSGEDFIITPFGADLEQPVQASA